MKRYVYVLYTDYPHVTDVNLPFIMGAADYCIMWVDYPYVMDVDCPHIMCRLSRLHGCRLSPYHGCVLFRYHRCRLSSYHDCRLSPYHWRRLSHYQCHRLFLIQTAIVRYAVPILAYRASNSRIHNSTIVRHETKVECI